MRYLIHILPLAALLFVAACTTGQRSTTSNDDDEVVAMVDRSRLLRSDIERDMPAGLSGVDSVTFARMYIDNWVLTELKMKRADEVLSASSEDIDRLVEGYRQSLIMRRLDQYYIDHYIDSEISEREISAYYRTYSSSFRLDHHEVQGVIVKAPRTFRNTSTLTTALRNAKLSGSTEEVTALAVKHGLTLTDQLGVWVSYSDFLSNLPTERSRSYDHLLSSSDVQHITTDDALFYFIITDVARRGEVAPLECVEEDIRRRIFADRRSSIVGQYEDELRHEAMAEGRIMLADTVLRNSLSYQTPEPQQEPTVDTSATEEVVEEIIEEDIEEVVEEVVEEDIAAEDDIVAEESPSLP